jgi:hypothetical protein
MHLNRRLSSADRLKSNGASVTRSFRSDAARMARKIAGGRWTAWWQRGRYEHIIHAESELNSAGACIRRNAENWFRDEENVIQGTLAYHLVPKRGKLTGELAEKSERTDAVDAE